MKTKIEKRTFHCSKGNHEATGSRYADYDGGWSCWKHTPYLGGDKAN